MNVLGLSVFGKLSKYFIKLLESDSDSGVLVKYMLNVLVFLNLMKVIQQYEKMMC